MTLTATAILGANAIIAHIHGDYTTAGTAIASLFIILRLTQTTR